MDSAIGSPKTASMDPLLEIVRRVIATDSPVVSPAFIMGRLCLELNLNPSVQLARANTYGDVLAFALAGHGATCELAVVCTELGLATMMHMIDGVFGGK
jgi:hypothetical protein